MSTCSVLSGILVCKFGTQGYSCVSDKNFVAWQSPGNGYGYRAFGELSHFVYCILQKVKKIGSLPLVENWENYMLPNHSSFAAIEEEHFLVGTRVHAALEKLSSSYLKKQFRNNVRRFLDEFCCTILSTAAARSQLGQGVSCFCSEIVLGGDDRSPLFLHGQLLDGFGECGWEKGSKVEACKVEFQSFVLEQRQLERHSTRKRPDVGNIPAYFAQQTGFQSRRHLLRVSSVLVWDALRCKLYSLLFVVGVSNDNPVSTGFGWEVARIHCELEWKCLESPSCGDIYCLLAEFCTFTPLYPARFLQRKWDQSACFCRQCCWLDLWPIYLWALAESAPWGLWSHFSGSEKDVWCCGCQTERGTGYIGEMIRIAQHRTIWGWGAIFWDWSADIR